MLRLQIECQGGLSFPDLTLDKLRFYLNGDPLLIPSLYELLFNHVLQVTFRPAEPDTSPAPVVLRPRECLSQVGFEPDEGLLPYPSGSPHGHRLLTELFTFPAKFLFLDLGGWGRVRRAGFRKRLEVIICLDRTVKRLEQAVSTATFLLGCTPVVNLFEKTAEPLHLAGGRDAHRVVPDQANAHAVEVYSVDAVSASGPGPSQALECQPFYLFRHAATGEERQVFWFSSRRPWLGEGDADGEVYVHLLDLAFRPFAPTAGTLTVRTTCTNRHLPAQLQAGAALTFELEAAAPLSGIGCVRTPTAPLRPPVRRGRAWRLVSHLTLNHLSLSDPVEGLEALQEILRLYDLSDPSAGQQQAVFSRQMIEGVVALSSREVTGRVAGAAASGFCSGTEVTLTFDAEKYFGVGAFLFASVLERFLGQYASVNSFCQLVARVAGAAEPFKKWPPRAGDLPVL